MGWPHQNKLAALKTPLDQTFIISENIVYQEEAVWDTTISYIPLMVAELFRVK